MISPPLITDVVFLGSSWTIDKIDLDGLRRLLPNKTISRIALDEPFTLTSNERCLELLQAKQSVRIVKDPAIFYIYWPASYSDVQGLSTKRRRRSFFVQRQWNTAIEAIEYYLDDCNCLVRPRTARALSNKILWAISAQYSGWFTHECVVTNEPTAIGRLLEGAGVVGKCVSDTGDIGHGLRSMPFHVTPLDLNHPARIRQAPIRVERLVEASHSHRVYCFQTDRIAITWKAGSVDDSIDDRGNQQHLEVLVQPPAQPMECILDGIAQRGLTYFCADFLEANGLFYLLDINPHGTWFWLPSSARNVLDKAYHAMIERFCEASGVRPQLT